MRYFLTPVQWRLTCYGLLLTVLVVVYCWSSSSTGLPASLSASNTPLLAPSQPLPQTDAALNAAQLRAARLVVDSFMSASFTHEAGSFAAVPARISVWADSAAAGVVLREFALQHLAAYYQQTGVRQLNVVDSVQQVPRPAGYVLVRVFSHNQILQANKLVRSYPVVGLLMLRPISPTGQNPSAHLVSSFRFVHPAMQPELDARFTP